MVTKAFLLVCLFLSLNASSAVAAYEPKQKQDPYLINTSLENKKNYQVNLRIINRGAKVDKATLEKQLLATEKIYSQCEGVNFKVNVVDTLETSWTNDQDNLTDVFDSLITITQSFINFFSPFVNSKNNAVIDVHLADYLSAAMRASKNKSDGQIFLGQAYNERGIGVLLHDFRTANSQPSLHQLAGDSLVLAFELLQHNNGINRKILDSDIWAKKKKRVYKYSIEVYHHSLLAHELGHILLETQDPKISYKDHFCPGLNDFCEKDNLMSSGGSEDIIYFDIKKKKRLGYSALPQVEPEQCAALVSHPKVFLLPN